MRTCEYYREERPQHNYIAVGVCLNLMPGKFGAQGASGGFVRHFLRFRSRGRQNRSAAVSPAAREKGQAVVKHQGGPAAPGLYRTDHAPTRARAPPEAACTRRTHAVVQRKAASCERRIDPGTSTIDGSSKRETAVSEINNVSSPRSVELVLREQQRREVRPPLQLLARLAELVRALGRSIADPASSEEC
eukprot:scaffold1059_cov119-Isochrysis_galbana.AAC.6